MLSICIATYNRGAFIGETLESILAQASDDVEIVVLDGGSTDNTGHVIRHYETSFPRLRWIRQDEKKGIDHDFAEAVRFAKGEYCWLFSDDDVLMPGAIKTVLAEMKKGYSVIIANSEVRDAKLSNLLESRKLAFVHDRIYPPQETEHLLLDCGRYMSFIGCVIIKKELWEKREKERYFGSYFVHVAVIFQSQLPEPALVIAKPIVSIRYGNAMWFAKYFEIWMFKWPNLIWSLPGYSDDVKRRVCPKEPWRNIARLFMHRAKGAYTISRYCEWLEPRLGSYWARSLSKAVAYLPGGIANFMGLVYYTMFSRNPARLLVRADMVNSPFYCWAWRKRRSRVNQS